MSKNLNINPLVKKPLKRAELAERLKDSSVAYDYVSGVINYCSETGLFTNKIDRHGRSKAGMSATTKRSNGYLVICLRSAQYLAHRVAWLCHYRKWPENVIDHINGDITDNRIENLRDVTVSVNAQNRNGAQSNNKLGLLGVSYNKSSGKYRAAIKAKGIYKVIGLFCNPEDAHLAYCEAKKELHKEAARP